jgi:GDP-L-fucose synthase
MRVFVAGHGGLVGSAVLRTKPSNVEVVVQSREELSLTDELTVFNFLSQNKIDSIILAAAKVGGIGANSTDHKNFLLENLKIQNAILSAASKLKNSISDRPKAAKTTEQANIAISRLGK